MVKARSISKYPIAAFNTAMDYSKPLKSEAGKLSFLNAI
jgi:hypothetical protein